MGLIRFIFFLLIAGVVWFMVKNYVRKQELRARREQERRLAGGKIVRCAQCDVHLPEQQALREDGNWFCSPAHRQAWLGRSNDKS